MPAKKNDGKTVNQRAKERRKPVTVTTYKRSGKEIVKALAHGRPGEYNSKAHDDLAFKFLLLGCTEEEVARHLDITHHVFIEWKKRYPSFAQAIIDGGEKADAEIAHKLYERAKGYSYNETTTRNDGEKTIVTNSKKVLPPDIRALEIWLRNRTASRKRWSSKPEDDVPPPPTININSLDFSKLPDTVIQAIIDAQRSGS